MDNHCRFSNDCVARRRQQIYLVQSNSSLRTQLARNTRIRRHRNRWNRRSRHFVPCTQPANSPSSWLYNLKFRTMHHRIVHTVDRNSAVRTLVVAFYSNKLSAKSDNNKKKHFIEYCVRDVHASDSSGWWGGTKAYLPHMHQSKMPNSIVSLHRWSYNGQCVFSNANSWIACDSAFAYNDRACICSMGQNRWRSFRTLAHRQWKNNEWHSCSAASIHFWTQPNTIDLSKTDTKKVIEWMHELGRCVVLSTRKICLLGMNSDAVAIRFVFCPSMVWSNLLQLCWISCATLQLTNQRCLVTLYVYICVFVNSFGLPSRIPDSRALLLWLSSYFHCHTDKQLPSIRNERKKKTKQNVKSQYNALMNANKSHQLWAEERLHYSNPFF